jgi:chromosome segregation ATPase
MITSDAYFIPDIDKIKIVYLADGQEVKIVQSGTNPDTGEPEYVYILSEATSENPGGVRLDPEATTAIVYDSAQIDDKLKAILDAQTELSNAIYIQKETLDATDEELAARLDVLKEELLAVKDSIPELPEEVDLTDIYNDLTQAKTDIEAIQAKEDETSVQVEDLKNKDIELESKDSELETKLNELEPKFESLAKDLLDTRDDLAATNTNVDDLDKKIDSTATEINDRITKLHASDSALVKRYEVFGDDEVSGLKQDLETQIDALSVKTTTLNTTVSSFGTRVKTAEENIEAQQEQLNELGSKVDSLHELDNTVVHQDDLVPFTNKDNELEENLNTLKEETSLELQIHTQGLQNVNDEVVATKGAQAALEDELGTLKLNLENTSELAKTNETNLGVLSTVVESNKVVTDQTQTDLEALTERVTETEKLTSRVESNEESIVELQNKIQDNTDKDAELKETVSSNAEKIESLKELVGDVPVGSEGYELVTSLKDYVDVRDDSITAALQGNTKLLAEEIQSLKSKDNDLESKDTELGESITNLNQDLTEKIQLMKTDLLESDEQVKLSTEETLKGYVTTGKLTEALTEYETANDSANKYTNLTQALADHDVNADAHKEKLEGLKAELQALIDKATLELEAVKEMIGEGFSEDGLTVSKSLQDIEYNISEKVDKTTLNSLVRVSSGVYRFGETRSTLPSVAQAGDIVNLDNGRGLYICLGKVSDVELFDGTSSNSFLVSSAMDPDMMVWVPLGRLSLTSLLSGTTDSSTAASPGTFRYRIAASGRFLSNVPSLEAGTYADLILESNGGESIKAVTFSYAANSYTAYPEILTEEYQKRIPVTVEEDPFNDVEAEETARLEAEWLEQWEMLYGDEEEPEYSKEQWLEYMKAYKEKLRSTVE